MILGFEISLCKNKKTNILKTWVKKLNFICFSYTIFTKSKCWKILFKISKNNNKIFNCLKLMKNKKIILSHQVLKSK